MEVVIPTMDFEFNSAMSSPYVSAPATPKRFGDYYFSAPTSPRRLSEFYHDFNDLSVTTTTPSAAQFPKSPRFEFEDDFAFHVGEESEKTTIPAEELFDHGKIRPLSAISNVRAALSPRRNKQNDPSATPISKRREQERGRERVSSLSSSSRRATRSVSPYRVSKYPWEEEQQQQEQSTKQPTLSSSSSKGYRKWRLKDFFLFRSASEGRASDKDPLKKYTALFKKHEDVKNSSFRSSEGSKRRGQVVSAHELHYTKNRAVSEDLKKKTFLPYKQGILGRLSFNPAVHALANGFGFSRK
ncbi:hypothetical protein LOK49_LG08G00659 [Camellia lanceoleosa]|uniref:Uncharacterized protein n=1 Tax=Camellia lanceoleosa TaxID=1840588 RepID=A0ACC0GVG9_9ERIC|nr:hypothetical protein LOK49_LG08G00659 [Camellia lanceoleosa]